MAAPAHIARENGKRGGRPLGATGAATRLSRLKANELQAQGNTPLDVMIENMLLFHREAKSLTEELEQMVPQLKAMDSKNPEFLQALDQLVKKQEKMFLAREKSQKCAVEAAPYVHARLAAIVPAPKPGPNDPNAPGSLPKTLEATSPTEAAVLYQRLIGGQN